MNFPSKHLLLASAAVLAVSGLLLLFAPDLLGDLVHSTSAPSLLVHQLLAGAWLGLAFLNWHSRTTMIGGIYGRPIVLANFANFFIAGISILKSGMSHDLPVPFWIAGGIASVFAFAFALRIYVPPPEFRSSGSSEN